MHDHGLGRPEAMISGLRQRQSLHWLNSRMIGEWAEVSLSTRPVVRYPAAASFLTVVSPELDLLEHDVVDEDSHILVIRYSCHRISIPSFNHKRAIAIGLFVERARYRTPARIWRMCSGGASPETYTTRSSLAGFPRRLSK